MKIILLSAFIIHNLSPDLSLDLSQLDKNLPLYIIIN